MVLRTRCIRHAAGKGLPNALRSFHRPVASRNMAGPPENRYSPQIAPAIPPTEVKRKDARATFAEKRRSQKMTEKMGSNLEDRWLPDMLFLDPPKPSDVTLELLMANQTHMGHATSTWNPENSRYIMGVREGIHIISLEVTAAHLRRAARVVEEVSYRGGIILFVGTRKGQSRAVAAASDLAGACRLFTRWTPGLITNRGVLLKSNIVNVVDEHDERIPGFEEYSMTPEPIVPDLVVCFNPLENAPLLHECALENIPTIGIIDTDADPSKVTYIIPANDDSLRSVGVIAGVLGRAGQAGTRRRLKDAKEGIVAWKTHSSMERSIEGIRKRITKAILAAGLDPEPRPPQRKEASLAPEGFLTPRETSYLREEFINKGQQSPKTTTPHDTAPDKNEAYNAALLSENEAQTTASRAIWETTNPEEAAVTVESGVPPPGAVAGFTLAPDPVIVVDTAKEKVLQPAEDAVSPASPDPTISGPEDGELATTKQEAEGHQANSNPATYKEPAAASHDLEPASGSSLAPTEPVPARAETKNSEIVRPTQTVEATPQALDASESQSLSRKEAGKALPTGRVQGTEDLIMMEAQLAEKLESQSIAKPNSEEQQSKTIETSAPAEDGEGTKKD